MCHNTLTVICVHLAFVSKNQKQRLPFKLHKLYTIKGKYSKRYNKKLGFITEAVFL